jgi:hypothetical protein
MNALCGLLRKRVSLHETNSPFKIKKEEYWSQAGRLLMDSLSGLSVFFFPKGGCGLLYTLF